MVLSAQHNSVKTNGWLTAPLEDWYNIFFLLKGEIRNTDNKCLKWVLQPESNETWSPCGFPGWEPWTCTRQYYNLDIHRMWSVLTGTTDAADIKCLRAPWPSAAAAGNRSGTPVLIPALCKHSELLESSCPHVSPGAGACFWQKPSLPDCVPDLWW